MHASHGSSAGRERNAVLRVVSLKPVSRELLNAKGASEETTGVEHWLYMNEPGITQYSRKKLHGYLIPPHSSSVTSRSVTSVVKVNVVQNQKSCFAAFFLHLVNSFLLKLGDQRQNT
jgi:hypothetical protein